MSGIDIVDRLVMDLRRAELPPGWCLHVVEKPTYIHCSLNATNILDEYPSSGVHVESRRIDLRSAEEALSASVTRSQSIALQTKAQRNGMYMTPWRTPRWPKEPGAVNRVLRSLGYSNRRLRRIPIGERRRMARRRSRAVVMVIASGLFAADPPTKTIFVTSDWWSAALALVAFKAGGRLVSRWD